MASRASERAHGGDGATGRSLGLSIIPFAFSFSFHVSKGFGRRDNCINVNFVIIFISLILIFSSFWGPFSNSVYQSLLRKKVEKNTQQKLIPFRKYIKA